MFPSTSSRETSGLSGKKKTNCFHRDHTLSVHCFSSPCVVGTNCGQSEIKHVLPPKLLSPCYKRFGLAFSCAYTELWMHLAMGSLESTQEARVALG